MGLHVLNNNVTYFDSFGVEHIPKETEIFIGNKNITTNIYEIQAYNSIMCGYFCIRFIDFMLKNKFFEKNWLQNWPFDFKLYYYRRYVADIFALSTSP